MATQLK